MPNLSRTAHSMKHDTSFGVLTGNNVESLPFKAGDIIFREGDEAVDLFIVKADRYGFRSATGRFPSLHPTLISARWR